MRLITVTACLTLLCVSAALCAPAGGGAASAPLGPLQIAIPDLVVKQVEVSRGGGEFPPYTFKITVANIGTRDAGPTKTGIIQYVLVRTDQPMQAGYLGEVATPAIPAGGQTVVALTLNYGWAKGYLFVTADFPTTSALLGAVREKSEGNNTLNVPLDTSASFPRTFK